MRQCLEQLRKYAVELGAEVPVEVRAGIADDPAAAIVAAATEVGAALLVLTTHGRRGIARLLRGSVVEQVLRQATVPVLCMPAPKEPPA